MEARAESLRPKFVVEIVGKNEGRSMPEHRLGILRHCMEVEVPGRKNRPDAPSEFRPGLRTRLRTHPFGSRFLLSAGTGGRGEKTDGRDLANYGAWPSPSKSRSDT